MLKPDSLINLLVSLNPQQRTDALRSLSLDETRTILTELDNTYKEDPWLWFKEEVYTQDEATQKRLPWPDKDYLKDLVHLLRTERLLIFPKSRRMMVSWLMAAYSVWLARYHPHHAIFVQSETEQKASYITEKRCCFIEDNLREPFLRRKYRPIRTKQGTIGKISYEDTQSYIWAIPQGGSVIRTYTFSLLFMDESDFQDEGADALTAALSIAQVGGSNQIVLVSTSNGPTGICAEICRGAGFSRWT